VFLKSPCDKIKNSSGKLLKLCDKNHIPTNDLDAHNFITNLKKKKKNLSTNVAQNGKACNQRTTSKTKSEVLRQYKVEIRQYSLWNRCPKK